jgi:hypothetical protein
MRKKMIWMAPLGVLAMAAFIALGGEAIVLLWNWLLPSLFGWRQINFWQALGLLALCRILFGGFRLGGNGHSLGRRRMARRWENMTPEEREKFREGWRARCGSFEPPEAKPSS